LGAVPPDERDRLIKVIAEAGISVICLPATDMHLGGRKDTHNVRRTLTPVRALRKGGVNVCLATNNIRNAFTPYNNGDIFSVAFLAVAACHLGGADDLPAVLPMITTNPAKALGIRDYGLEVGKPADMVLLSGKRVEDAVIDLPAKPYVIKGGRITVRTKCETVFLPQA
jgi:cytosine deaminase